MGRWSRTELEGAFDRYQEAALKGAQTKDWRDWAQCFTEDATYVEHHYGRFWGRERILQWITDTMTTWPASHMTAFPVSWYSVDEDKGWIICEVMNRLEDIGDGKIHQEPNLTVLHYAGNGLFSYEEDAYNPQNMGATIGAWIKARKAMQERAGGEAPNP